MSLEEKRLETKDYGAGFFRVVLRYGFMEEINVPAALAQLKDIGPQCKMMDTSFFLARQTLLAVVAAGHGDLARETVRLDAAQRGKRDGILQAADQPRRRARQPGRDLNLRARLRALRAAMAETISWVATVATIVAAFMTASNLGSRVTGYGFAVFTVGRAVLDRRRRAHTTSRRCSGPTSCCSSSTSSASGAGSAGRRRWRRAAAPRPRRASDTPGEALFPVSLLTRAPVRCGTGEVGHCIDAMAGCRSGRLDYLVVSEGGVAGVGETAAAACRGATAHVDGEARGATLSGRTVRAPRGAAKGPMAGALIVTAEIAPARFLVDRGAAAGALSGRAQPGARASDHVPRACRRRPKRNCARGSRWIVQRPPPAATIAGLMDLGGGVAFRIVSPDLDDIREELADGLHGLLGAQDSGGWRPHVTIQNKVAPKVARALNESLERTFAAAAAGDQRAWHPSLSRRPVGDGSRLYPFRDAS